ncbi:hypothetical protein [Candidatus Magnetobacterium casense]|uniref:hypothetical protein n=1 Tax=Candidatus Magnetobacterium casense TaxID=1455061 RepID=UPI00058F2C2E|nr:hypothetical protein [Candidatus Magnetobacterium casensis]
MRFSNTGLKKVVGVNVAIVALLFLTLSAYAGSVPNVFTSGTVAKSSEVNANFTYLGERCWDKSGGSLYYNGGNVGIGTSSPSTEFQIIDTNNNLEIMAVVGGGPTSGWPQNGKHVVRFGSQNNEGEGGQVIFSGSSGYQNWMVDTWQGNFRIAGDNPNSQATGDVLIGSKVLINPSDITVRPAGTLDVNGSIYQRGSQLHADYVFEPVYKLETIEEHKKFMFEEKHLKAIPKAKKDEMGQDIVEYGVHVRGILEELEKAHVYIAQMNDTIKSQQKIIEKLTDEVKTFNRNLSEK